MPHIVIEHTNLPINVRELMIAINQALVKAYPDEFPVPQAIKSRAFNVNDDYAIGIDAEEQPTLKFIHTNIRILSGRPDEIRIGIATIAKDAIVAFMDAQLPKDLGAQVQCTVEIGEIFKPAFQKVVYDSRA